MTSAWYSRSIVSFAPPAGKRYEFKEGVWQPEAPVLEAGLCLGCYTCAEACPHKAIIPPRASSQR